jgi:hypothetical protein
MMKLPKYVQAWVDSRDGRAYYYLRRRGRPRVRLPGLPWSPSFMAAYESALAGPRAAIGAGRIKPGSVAAVVAEYFDSQSAFGSKSAGTQRMRRGILERFRAAHGERPFALLPPEWIEALLDQKPPHAARGFEAKCAASRKNHAVNPGSDVQRAQYVPFVYTRCRSADVSPRNCPRFAQNYRAPRQSVIIRCMAHQDSGDVCEALHFALSY